ncbi:MAG: methyltransferase domain-containing protein, partial [bacterium]
RFAPVYDLFEGSVDWLAAIPRLRSRLFREIREPLLEVGAGSGKTLRAFRRLQDITMTDLSEGMLEITRRKAARLGMPHVRFYLADTQKLPFADHSFATVVSSQTLCTTPDPVTALREMARVCRPEGRILVIEHGPSTVGWIDRWIERREEYHTEKLACHSHRDHAALVREAGLNILNLERRRFGIFFLIEATPGR